MSEQKDNVKIEDVIHEKLMGDAQKNALEFFSAMRVNGFTFEYFDLGHTVGFTPTYKGKDFGCILLPGPKKEIYINIGLEFDFSNLVPVNDDMKETILAHVCICPSQFCSPPYCEENSEHPGCKNRWKIFGVEYESVCHAPLQFADPNAKTYETLKNLLLMIK